MSRIISVIVSLVVMASLLVSSGLAQAATGIANPGFETGNFSGWSVSGSAQVVTGYGSYAPKEGNYFAIVWGGCATNTVSQSFTLSAGQKVSGWAFFKAEDYLPYNDYGQVILYVAPTNVVLFSRNVAAVGNYGGTPWTYWEYTAPFTGSYTLYANSTNVGDCALSSVLGVDAHQPALVTDSVPPTVSAAATPAPNGAGWNNSDATVTITASDADSGVQSVSYAVNGGPTVTTPGNSASVTFNADGVYVVAYNAKDNAGNTSATASITASVDETKPTISGSKAPLANGAGWNITDVTVTYTCADNLSGVASCASPETLSAEAAGQSATGTVTDAAGNTASVTVSGINIDKTNPTATITTPANSAVYVLNEAVAAAYSCADSLSGVVSCAGTVANGSNIDTSTVGTHSFTVTSVDAAGNSTSVTHGHSVHYTFSGFLPPLPRTGGTFKTGSTIPIKWQLTDANGNYINDLSTVVALIVNGSPPSGSGRTALRYDTTSNQYIFNWQTKGLTPGSYTIELKLSDGTMHTVTVELKP
ncbi:MAG: PxKF domain-containing protein [Chloroflexi bacterium]|nr:PxKF domain-containing protein [Chloroflexota bacterium]